MPTPSDCVQGDGSVVDLTKATAEDLQRCSFAAGAVLTLEDTPAEPETASLAPALPPPRKPAMEPQQQPSNVPAPAPSTDLHDQPVAGANAPADAGVPAPVGQEAAGTLADDAPASPSAGELGDLISASGGGAVGLVAALIAVVGGTAGFKLWTKISEQKHEQSMKKLDIEQANAGLSGAQPPPCQAAHQTLVADIKALQARVVALEGRVEKTEKAAAGFDPSVDVGDLEDRVAALEKTFRKRARVGGE